MKHDTETGLFPALEAALKAASEPLDCIALFDMPAVRANAASANRVSDYLGAMWRKGQVVRTRAPKTGDSRSQWMYEWKGNRGPKYLDAVEFTPKVLMDRPSMMITEDGGSIILEFKNLVITVRQKLDAKASLK